MNEIIKIVIRSSSGFGPIDQAYEDKFVMTPAGMSYELKPCVQSDLNCSLKWSYKTNSSLFTVAFERVCYMMPDILMPNRVCDCTDVGMIDFTVIYSDKTKRNIRYWCTPDTFDECFSVIRDILPPCELVPEVLRSY